MVKSFFGKLLGGGSDKPPSPKKPLAKKPLEKLKGPQGGASLVGAQKKIELKPVPPPPDVSKLPPEKRKAAMLKYALQVKRARNVLISSMDDESQRKIRLMAMMMVAKLGSSSGAIVNTSEIKRPLAKLPQIPGPKKFRPH